LKSFFVFLLLFSFVYGGDSHYKNDLSYLNLSNTQKVKMEHILKEHRHALQNLREYKHDLEENKEKLFLESVLDEDKIRVINAKINEYSTKIKINSFKKTHELLTPEQRKKFEKYIDDWRPE